MRNRGLVLLASCGLICAAGCPKDGARTAGDGAASTAAAPAPDTRVEPAEPPPPIEPIEHGALVQEASKSVVQKLIRAHYDPERLGLKALDFSVRIQLRNNKGETHLDADAKWAHGGSPTVELRKVLRDGKPLVRDEKNGITTQLWTSLTYRARRLLDGIGTGFLRRRLIGLSASEGKARLAKGKLLLEYDDKEAGKTTVTIGDGYRVEQIHNVAKVGVTRAMTYEHQLVDGRYLVSGALLRVSLDKGAKLPARAAQAMRAADKTRYAMTYKKVGRYLLPDTLEKSMPLDNDQVKITFAYRSATP